MNKVYGVVLDVRLKEFGVRKPSQRELRLWVLEPGNAEGAIRKAKKFAMRKNGWDMGVPLSVRLVSVEPKGTIDVM